MSGSLDLKAILEQIKLKNAGSASLSAHDYKTNSPHEITDTPYRLIQTESKDEYNASDISSFFKLLPSANGEILIALDKKDILTPAKYPNYTINVPSDDIRRIQHTPPDPPGETRYFSYYNFSEIDFESSAEDLARQIANIYFKISKITQGKFIFIYGSENTIKRGHFVLFLFSLLENFDITFFMRNPYKTASNISSKIESLKKQGIVFTDEQIEALVKCAVKAKEYLLNLEKSVQKTALSKRTPLPPVRHEEKSTTPSPMPLPTMPWTQTITEALWKYRVAIVAMIILLILLTLSALFWSAMAGSAFTVAEMASALLATKIAALFIVIFLGLCLMNYVNELKPSIKGWIKIPPTDEHMPNASEFRSPTVHKFQSGKELIPRGLQLGAEDTQPQKPITRRL